MLTNLLFNIAGVVLFGSGLAVGLWLGRKIQGPLFAGKPLKAVNPPDMVESYVNDSLREQWEEEQRQLMEEQKPKIKGYVNDEGVGNEG
jgi:hypothetical protein